MESRNKTKYFAFISHICLPLCLELPPKNIKQTINNCIKKHRVYAYLSFVGDLSDLQLDSTVGRCTMTSPQSLNVYISKLILWSSSFQTSSNVFRIKENCLYLEETQFYLRLRSLQRRRKPRSIGNWRLHNLTNSCRLILFVQLCWKDRRKKAKRLKEDFDVFIGSFVAPKFSFKGTFVQ